MSEEQATYSVKTNLSETSIEVFAAGPCCRQFTDDNYRPPTTEEIRHVLKLLNLTGSQAAKVLGVSSSKVSGSRTIRKWTGGEREMPYATWHLLLAYAGIVKLEHELIS